MTFLIQHMITFIFTKRLGRFYEFPVLIHATDAILCASSGIFIQWFSLKISNNIDVEGISEIEKT